MPRRASFFVIRFKGMPFLSKCPVLALLSIIIGSGLGHDCLLVACCGCLLLVVNGWLLDAGTQLFLHFAWPPNKCGCSVVLPFCVHAQQMQVLRCSPFCVVAQQMVVFNCSSILRGGPSNAAAQLFVHFEWVTNKCVCSGVSQLFIQFVLRSPNSGSSSGSNTSSRSSSLRRGMQAW